jgi:hypothetical protein
MSHVSSAWETTPDDILNVIHQMGKKATGEQVHEIQDGLDEFLIEVAALRGDDMEEQTKSAYTEMKRQIIKNKLI